MAQQNTVIAIIDDDPELRDALKDLLSSYEYRTEIYASAEDFISGVSASAASCLVVDMQIGDITGVELVRHLSAIGFTFPIIFLTGSSDDVLRRQAFDLGCAAYLRKPISAGLLIDEIIKATE